MNNINDEIKDIKLPVDLTIVGIGGCGKELVYGICDNEWFLNQYLVEGRHLNVYIIDTDKNDKQNDTEKVSRIIKETEKSGNIVVSYYYLPEIANISYVTDLASDDIAKIIKNRKAEPSVKVWWLNDREYGITFSIFKNADKDIYDDFGGGVHRRRAISKAVFYKVLSRGESSDFPTFSVRGNIAIVVGLGGGTGSGMFIDMARYIRSMRGDEVKIYLFAVLPTTAEGDKEKLNAAIALTELEYINLNERLFNYIVLISLGPTGYKPGAKGAELKNFDSAVPYIFANSFYLEKGDMDVTNNKRPYSYFVFADAHIIEYPIEELKKVKQKFEDLIIDVESITNCRKELNAMIESFLSKIEHSEGIPTRDDFDFVKSEIKNVEKISIGKIGELFNYETVKEVNYYRTNYLKDIHPDKTNRYDDLIEYLSRLEKISVSELKDEVDKKLRHLIPESSKVLKDTAVLLKKMSGIKDETISTVLKELIKAKSSEIKSLEKLRTKIKYIEEDIRNLNAEIENKNKDLEEIKKQKHAAEEKINKTLNEIDKHIDELINLREKIKDTASKEKEIKNKIYEMISKFKNKEIRGDDETSWLKNSEIAGIEAKIDAISRLIGENLDELKLLIKNIALYYFYDYKLNKFNNRNLWQKIADYLKGDPKRKRRRWESMKEEKERYVREYIRENKNIVLHSPFEISIPNGFLTEQLNKNRDNIINKIIESLKSNYSIDRIDELKHILESEDRSHITKMLKEVLNKNLIKHTQKEDELEKKINDINNIKKEKQKSLEYLEEIDKLIDDILNYRRDIEKYYNSFSDKFNKINEIISKKSDITQGKYRTLIDVNPGILSLINDNSEMRVLDRDEKGKEELKKFINIVKSTYNKLINNYMLGVHNLFIPINDSERWNFGKGGLVISSTSPYITTEIVSTNNINKIIEEINDLLALRNRNDARLVTHNSAKPWEISMAFFVATGFLDNILPLVAGDGYWEVYENNKDNLLHHALLLEEGKYIIRTKKLELKEAGKIANKEEKASVKDDIIKLYEEKSLPKSVAG